MLKKFAFFDGDNIGDIIEKWLHKNMIEEAQFFSQNVKEAFDEIHKTLISLDEIEIIIFGGDDLLISFNSDIYNEDFFEKIRVSFQSKTQATISCGIGSTIQESIFCLYLAKLYGKNQLIER